MPRSGPADPERRRLLKLAAAAAAGGGLALLGLNALSGGSAALPAKAHTNPATGKTPTAGGSGAYPKVNVRYFQMESALPGLESEEYILPDPARFSQLLSEVIGRHPVISGMMANMLVLVDGLAARADTPLSSGDEVDFIPAVNGG